MKKRILSILLLILVCAVCMPACSSTGDSSGADPKNEVSAPVENTDDPIKDLQQQIDDLSKEIGKLKEENESLLIKIIELEGQPIIDGDKISQIKQDYLSQYGFAFGYDNYYGAYGGSEVFFISGDAAVVKKVNIAGVEFEYNYDWEILVWKDGQFKSLESAYDSGWLSYFDLKIISIRHSAISDIAE